MIGHQPVTRSTLIRALSECAEYSVRARARRFLAGLSSDELEFLSEILGACILESSENMARAAAFVESRHCHTIRSKLRRKDLEQKLILFREFLSLSNTGPAAA